MRLIGTVENEQRALIFSQFLHEKEIPHQVEIEPNKDWGSTSYGSNHCRIWIDDEEHLRQVLQWFHLFNENPHDPLFSVIQPAASSWLSHTLPGDTDEDTAPPPPPPSQPAGQSGGRLPLGWITRILVALCTFFLLANDFLLPMMQIPNQYSSFTIFSSPIDRTFLYDFPKPYELINKFIRLYGVKGLEHQEALPSEAERLLQKINQTPYWPGYYHLLLREGWSGVEEGLSKYPTFEKIREGEIWRLFTPCLLHGSLIHLLFNMLWLIVLGKQMEQKLTRFRYLLFILLVGVFSNTAQYLMSGPNFLGFSGILIGMLAFIWARQRHAAWEGYQMDRQTFIFMLLFILGMAGVQTVSFILEKSFEWSFSPNIANMAHLSGGIGGYALGRLNFFSWRHTS